MRSYRFALSVAGLGVVIAAVIIFFGVRHLERVQEASVEKRATSLTETPKRAFKLPLDGGYRITEAAEIEPKILEAHIDPPDVHVGDKQTLSVVVQDPADIVSAIAYIGTDHGTTTLPLVLVGPVAQKDLMPERYAVNNDHKLIALDPGSRVKPGMTNTAEAADAPRLKYSASWIVKDTHDTRYHTTFVVKDEKGRENSITIAWSDACSIPVGGNWSLAANNGADCVISSVDGVDGGNATIGTYTLTLNSTFAFNPGYSISVTNGAIAVGSGGQIQQTYLWVRDGDGDGYPNSTNLAQDAQPANSYRRSLGNDYDCNDGNQYIYITRYDVNPTGQCLGATITQNVSYSCGGGTCSTVCTFYKNSLCNAVDSTSNDVSHCSYVPGC